MCVFVVVASRLDSISPSRLPVDEGVVLTWTPELAQFRAKHVWKPPLQPALKTAGTGTIKGYNRLKRFHLHY